ncbi:Pre-rRNA-processing protein TSR2-domain-containing protein [Kockovaella imperatae]|uniref:Pre-rRNA-processing protein TSR2-domain-containing protein n=1 Tax=Kockovaella imperatae TaxID=4999 RepID=A0A1Y1UE18_9TREE|nr:Pre-rRNA-processing protein TSR2-domain-containing protein [Kockovaella imperatae]ORX35325.1 Pre-rRNA-processing protein TSR2-domain-containing protein [Kockovaella imperatae]
MASSSSSSNPAQAAPSLPSPTILLFARGVVALLDLWPALTIAVAEQWGGAESAEKKVWMASVIVDEFESRAVFLPSTAGAGSDTATPAAPVVDPRTADDPPLDLDDLGDLIHQMMSDEFDANIEDNSIDAVTADILRLWKDLLSPSTNTSPENLVSALETRAGQVKRSGVNASSGGGPQEMNGGDVHDDEAGDWTDSDNSEDDGEVPQLVPVKQEKEKVEPVFDEDGFELVQKGRRR